MRVILNPAARHGAGRRLRPLIERELESRRLEFDIVETEGPGHAVELARRAADASVARVVAAGGDGTVHEVANGLMSASGAPPSLGLIPIGTGNDFVKMVPGTSSRAQAFETLASGIEKPVDVGVARWDDRTEYFMNAMGTGIDVEVVRQMRRSGWMPGMMIYLAALMRALVNFRPIPVRLQIDELDSSGSIMILAVCNGPSIGGAFRVCPQARPDDGVLDVCVVSELPLHRILRVVPRVLRGTHEGQPGISMHRGTRVRLGGIGGDPFPFQLDGELREANGDVDVSLAARQLNVVCNSPAVSGRKA
ncbi:MAG: diacylglycerol kinase family lipid kinase [Gemmatimonadetes bacterium]|nr:diacylglycerol kinase family lipid kinase [Gemmatimonadota bacterium]